MALYQMMPGEPPSKKLKLDEREPPVGYVAGAGRGAKVPMQTRADLGIQATKAKTADAVFGAPPPGYIPGRGRGATGFIGGVSRDEVDREEDKADLGDNNFDEFNGYGGSLFADGEYDEEDREADLVYDAVEYKLDGRRKKWREERMREEITKSRASKPTIQQQFADLKRELSSVSKEEWENIPDAQEHLKIKPKKNARESAVPDNVLQDARYKSSHGVAVGGMNTPMGGMNTPMGMHTPMGLRTPMGGMHTPMGLRTPMGGMNTPMGLRTPMGGMNTPMGMRTPMGGMNTPMGMHTPMGMRTPMGMNTPMGMRTPMGMNTPMGMRTPMGMNTPMGMRTPMGGGTPFGRGGSSMNDLGEARGTVLAVKLDRIMDSVSGQTVMDPKGYLTDLNSVSVSSDTDVQDIKKARTLLNSVITSNPKHAPGWIAAARLEEVAGKIQDSRELIAQGCQHCTMNEDVWLEAARLEKASNAKAVLAKAIKHIPHSVRLWLDAASREPARKRLQVLRKALEFIPNSVRLWKEAISREEEVNARSLLSRAVECVPHSVEMWLALAKLSPYKDAQKVLNEARKHVPTASQIWVTAAELEETQGNEKMVDLILTRALDSLAANGVTADRDPWFKHAEEAEKNGYLKTCGAIIKATIRVGLEDADAKLFKHTCVGDAEASLARGAIETARAIYTHALAVLKTKKGLWLRLADLERKYGSPESLDAVLGRATQFCPGAEILWLMAAKQKWVQGDVGGARGILAEAFTHSKDSEAIHLAAVKLENDNREIQRSRLLLQRARTQCDTAKVWMQSLQLEREQGKLDRAIQLCGEALTKHSNFPKLYMIYGQLFEERDEMEEAGKAFERGLQACPRNPALWLCAAKSAQKVGRMTKARSILEKARVNLPKHDLLWLASIDVEVADGNEGVAMTLMSRALQECPSSGPLWARAIFLEAKAGQNAKSVDALKKCENDTYVIVAVARLFWKEMKTAKARKWFNRAVSLNPALGDAWAYYMAFELACGSDHEQRDLLLRFAEAQPNQGLEWCPVVKAPQRWRLKWAQKMRSYLELAFPESLKTLSSEMDLLLQGEEVQIEEDDEDLKSEEGGEKTFLASKTFDGARPGYAFKSGPRGVGYYRDVKSETVKREKLE